VADFGGVSVKEMSADVRDAVVNPSVPRDPLSAANPIATIADIGGGTILTAQFEWANPGANFSTGALGFTPKLAILLFNQGRSGSLGMAKDLPSQCCLSWIGDGGDHMACPFQPGDTPAVLIGEASVPGDDADVFLTAMSAAGLSFNNVIAAQANIQYFKLYLLG